MRRFLSFLLFILFGNGLWSQITIDNSVFPKAGDTLTMVCDGVPVGTEVGASGPDQNWNFSKLQGLLQKSIFTAPTEGENKADFPTANLLRKDNSGRELYLRSTDATVEYLGFSGLDLLGLDVETVTKFSPALEERKVPLNYRDKNVFETETVLSFAAESLPGSFLDSIPISPDSVRLRIVAKRQDEVDAWGVITIPGGDYEVLREKRVEYRTTFMDTKIGSLPWLDITDLVDDVLPFVGEETKVQYYFISEEEKEPIAILHLKADNKTVEKVEYKGNDVKSNINYVNRGKVDVFAYPNPAIEEVRFEFLNLPKGVYTLKIYNILGVEVWKEDYKINKNQTARVDLTDYRKGTYLYSIVNQRGKTITTKRLIILRP